MVSFASLVLEDDSSHLHEVLELFSDVTLPLKVDKLIKVSSEDNLSLLSDPPTSILRNKGTWKMGTND